MGDRDKSSGLTKEQRVGQPGMIVCQSPPQAGRRDELRRLQDVPVQFDHYWKFLAQVRDLRAVILPAKINEIGGILPNIRDHLAVGFRPSTSCLSIVNPGRKGRVSLFLVCDKKHFCLVPGSPPGFDLVANLSRNPIYLIGRMSNYIGNLHNRHPSPDLSAFTIALSMLSQKISRVY